MEQSICNKLTLNYQNKIFEICLCIINKKYSDLEKDISIFLHEYEKSYLSSLNYEARRYNYLLGRYCAKKALKKLLNLSSCKDVAINSGIFSQPVIQFFNSTKESLQVSISHCEPYAATVVFPETCPLGIDIESENITDTACEAIKNVLTNDEICLFESLEVDSRLALVMAWTAKEALSKALRCGLVVPLKIFEIKEFCFSEGVYYSFYKNFSQYKTLIFRYEKAIVSLTLPFYVEFNITEILTKENHDSYIL